MSARIKLSINNWRMICQRLAPIARRTANSRARAEPPAASRVDRFAQAMTRTRATEHGEIAMEDAFPQAIADHRQPRPADTIFLLGENAADLRRQSDDLEKIGGHERAGNLFRLATLQTAQVVGLASRDSEVFENF